MSKLGGDMRIPEWCKREADGKGVSRVFNDTYDEDCACWLKIVDAGGCDGHS